MSTDASSIIRKAAQELNNGDPKALQNLIADDVVYHIPGKSRLAGDYRGKGDLVENYLGVIQGMVDALDLVYDEVYTGPDNSVVGTLSSSFTRNGKQLELEGAIRYQFENDMISEAWLHIKDIEAWDAFWSE